MQSFTDVFYPKGTALAELEHWYKYLFVLICIPTFLMIYHKWRDVEMKRVDKIAQKAMRPPIKAVNGRKQPQEMLETLHKNVQKAIESLQEPEDGCNGTTKVLVCTNNFGQAGFGSIAHRYAPCLQIAFGLGRVAVWNHREYAHFGGYSRWMKPPTKACAHLRDKKFSNGFKARFNIKNETLWNENLTALTNDAKYLFLDIRFSFSYPRHVPGTVPHYLEAVLSEIGVKVPWLWFYSQFMYYLIGRPNDYFTKVLKDIKLQMNFSRPCIGVHIRQDAVKVRDESTFIATEKYSKLAMQIYDDYMPNSEEKKIYVATDVKTNFNKMKTLVPENVRILYLPDRYQQIGLNLYFKRKFNPDALESILLDIYFLWNSDFIICMHSSNVCRLMEELKYATTAFLDGRTVYSLYQDYYALHPGFTTDNQYFLMTRDKPKTCQKCMNYRRKQLFLTRKPFSVSDDGFIQVRSQGQKGFIQKNDSMIWPGYPHYETVVDLPKPL